MEVILRTLWDKTIPNNFLIVNATSGSKNSWERGLSPFHLGPIDINQMQSKNFENAWQYSKVYKEHVDENENPTSEYFIWRNKGYNKQRADRYSMGKGIKPLYSLLNNKKLNYIQARKEIYIPLYANYVVKTESFKKLLEVASNNNIAILDYDVYDYEGLTKEDIVNNPNKKMGHGFVLLWLVKKFFENQNESNKT